LGLYLYDEHVIRDRAKLDYGDSHCLGDSGSQMVSESVNAEGGASRMSTITVLGLVLFALMTLIGGKTGATAFLSLIFNFGLLFLAIVLISWGFPAMGVTLKSKKEKGKEKWQ